MRRVETEVEVRAPRERCFDLARSVEAHLETAASTGERVVAGRTAGLFELNDEVTWEARHLGVRQRLSSRVVAMQPPVHFRDAMLEGAFKSLEHEHRFVELDAGATLMRDVIRFEVPGGAIGRTIVVPHLRKFIEERNAKLKAIAESDAWRRYVAV